MVRSRSLQPNNSPFFSLSDNPNYKASFIRLKETSNCHYNCTQEFPDNRYDCFNSCFNHSSVDYFSADSGTRFFAFVPLQLTYPVKELKRIISYSLYGRNLIYFHNLHKVVRSATSLYPGWTLRFYISSDLPSHVCKFLVESKSEVILVFMKSKKSDHFHGMFWRFFVANDPNTSRYMVRDADAYPIKREQDAVSEWIKEGHMFHVMRDHPQHNIEMLGGMWGGLVNLTVLNFASIYHSARDYYNQDGKGVDQYFLKDYVWPIVLTNMTCHSSYDYRGVHKLNCKDFPTPRTGKEFVGNSAARG